MLIFSYAGNTQGFFVSLYFKLGDWAVDFN